MVDETDVSAPGTLTYTITVVNTGNVDLTGVVVSDVFAGGATLSSGDGSNPGVLDVGETWVYTADYDVTQADINAGTALTNSASVVSDQTTLVSAGATTTIVQLPSLSIDKVVDETDVSAPGTLTYAITVVNTGNVDLTNVVVSDVFAGGATLVSGDTNGNDVLETTETWVYSADYDVTQAVINAGTDLVNTASVDTDQTVPVWASTRTTITQSPTLTIDKTVDEQAIAVPGTLTYTITIANTGNVDLTNVVVSDVFAGGATLSSGDVSNPGVLDVGETWVYSADYDVTQADINDGSDLVNTASVATTEVPGPTSDSATTTVGLAPDVRVSKVVDEASVAAPGTLTYTITIDNIGNVDLTGVVVSDVFAGGATRTSGDTNGNDVLETSELWVYSADYDVTQADINAGSDLVNTASVVSDQTTLESASASTTIVRSPSLSIDKVVDEVVVSAPGTLAYAITVANTGNVDLTNVVVSDLFAGGATLVSGDTNGNDVLETSELWVYSADYDVTQADINAGSDLVNTASVVTDQTTLMAASATTTITQSPALSIDKTVDQLSIAGPGTLTYTITVDNTGNVDLTDVAVSDVFAGGATLVSGDGNGNDILETSEIWVYSADYDVTQADINAGSDLVNSASVDSDQTAPATAGATTTITQSPSLSIDKTVDQASIAAPGTLTYTITVVNTGNVDLTGVVVNDVFAGGATLSSGDVSNPDVLDVGEMWEYTADYDVTQADINDGSDLVNTASVDTDQTAPTSASVTTTISQSPALSIDKTVDQTSTAAPGTLTYTITVDNTGNMDLTNVVVTDVFAGGAVLASGDGNDNDVLETTETWIFTADYDVTQADINAGSDLVNTASVDTDQTAPTSTSVTTTISQSPSLSIDKTVDQLSIAGPGTLTYTITVDNTGNVDLTDVAVSDVFAGGATLVTGDGNGNDILETSEIWVYSADYDVTQVDINAGGDLINTAAVDTDQTATASAVATTSITQSPSLSIDKTVDEAVVSAPGTLPYTITVVNTGNVDLTNVVVSDVFAGGATLSSGDVSNPGVLDVGETWVYSADYDVTQADINDGSDLVNTASVDTDQTVPTSAIATTTITQSPALTIDKTVDQPVVSAPGTLPYTITVVNTGNVDLTNVVVSDVFAGGATLSSGDVSNPGVLDVGETWIYTADYDVTQADINDGSDLVNTASVDTDQTVPTSAIATTTITQSPALSIDKTVDQTSTAAPGTLTYTITVVNTGNVDLTNVVVSDVFAGGATLSSGDVSNPGVLDVGETWVYSADYDVTQADINDGSDLVNTASVDTDQTVPTAATATTTITQSPSSTIDKTVDQPVVSAPGTLTYTVTVVNTGNVDLTNVVVSDVFAGGATLSSGDVSNPGVLDVGETWIYTADYDVTQADINEGTDLVNTASVDTDQTAPTSADANTAVTQNPAVTIVKTGSLLSDVDGSGDVTLGDELEYVVTATNSGNVTLTDVLVADPLLGTTESCASLAPNATCVLTGVHVVTIDGADAGMVVNAATVTAADPGDDPITDDVEVTITVEQDPRLGSVKTARYDDGSGQITYTYEVENTGNVTVFDVTVSEGSLFTGTNAAPTPAFVSGGADLDLEGDAVDLVPGAIATFTAVYSVSQDDIDVGEVENQALAAGVDPGSEPVTDLSDDESTAFGADDPTVTPIDQNPAIAIAKAAGPIDQTVVAPSDRDDAGDTVTYSYAVTNTGNVTLVDAVVTDDRIAADAFNVVCADGDVVAAATNVIERLPVGSSVTCAATYTLTSDDVENGSVTNTATAVADDPSGTPVPPAIDVVSVAITREPALIIDKTANVASFDERDSVITYRFEITNIGNVALSDAVVVDDLIPAGCTAPQTELAPGGTTACEATYEVTQADLDLGWITNVAFARATDGTSTGIESPLDSLTIPAVQHPSLTLTKLADVASYDAEGDVITYTFDVANSGNVTIRDIVIDDPLLPGGVCTPAASTLAPDESTDCVASVSVSPADLLLDGIVNTATTSGTYNAGADTVTSEPAEVTVDRIGLDVVKIASPTETPAVGADVTYTVLVTNTSATENLTLTTLVDDRFGSLAGDGRCAIPTVVAPGDTFVCEFVEWLSGPAGGIHLNTVTATAEQSDGETTSGSDSATVTYGSAILGDFVWLDRDGNGMQDAGEPGLPGVTVDLFRAASTPGVDPPVASTTTDATGVYAFRGLVADSYRLVFRQALGTFTAQSAAGPAMGAVDSDVDASGVSPSILLASGAVETEIDAGITGTGTLDGTVVIDVDGLGTAVAPDDVPLAGVTVTAVWTGPDALIGTADDVPFPATTDAAGHYSMTDLPAGEYVVSVAPGSLPAGLESAFDAADPTANGSSLVTVPVGSSVSDIDFGFEGSGSVSGVVVYDHDADGSLGIGDPGLAGVTVDVTWAGPDTLFDTADDVVFTVETAVSGSYSVDIVPAGNIRVDIDESTLPGGLVDSFDADGAVNSIGVMTTALPAGGSASDLDAGYLGDRSLTGALVLDVSGDGLRDPDDPPLDGVTVTATWLGPDGVPSSDDVEFTTVTDGSGGYAFTGLPAGLMVIDVDDATLPAGLTSTFDPTGDTDGVVDGQRHGRPHRAGCGAGAGLRFHGHERPPWDGRLRRRSRPRLRCHR